MAVVAVAFIPAPSRGCQKAPLRWKRGVPYLLVALSNPNPNRHQLVVYFGGADVISALAAKTRQKAAFLPATIRGLGKEHIPISKSTTK